LPEEEDAGEIQLMGKEELVEVQTVRTAPVLEIRAVQEGLKLLVVPQPFTVGALSTVLRC
tara:strand:+ start:379 stop:558 length:180 start_codon:yes stop_codon:yes gene_type:complete